MSKLEIHVGDTFADSKRRVLSAGARARRGETVRESHLSFTSWEALAAVMTPRRLDMLRLVHRQPQASIAALSRALGRDYKWVHADVETLTAAGLLSKGEGGLRADYDEIQAAIAL